MNCNCISALLHCFCLLSIMTSSSLAFDYLSSTCNNATTYANGSTYSINLRRVMDHLVDNASLTGFGNYSYGQSPNRVYGLLQCTGNIAQEDCKSCSKEAESRFLDNCSNGIGGQVWMSDCFLQYSNSSFFSKLDIAGVYLPKINARIPLYDLPSRNKTFSFLSGLINIAIANLAPDDARFGSGSFTYLIRHGVSGVVYGLVQCLRDISIDDCKSCLSSALQGVDKCCSNQSGAYALLGSCTVRIEVYRIYLTGKTIPISFPADDSPAPSKVEIPLQPKVESPLHPKAENHAHQNFGTNSKKSSHRLAIILGITGSAILATVSVCIFAMRKKMSSLILKKQIALARDDEEAPHKMLFKKEQIVFSLQTLIEATGGFRSDTKLGEGRFGSVESFKMDKK